MFRDLFSTEVSNLNNEFLSSAHKPFSHVVVKDLLEEVYLRSCYKEFVSLSQNNLDKFVRYSDRDFEFEKYTLNKVDEMPELLSQLCRKLHSQEFVDLIEKITGLKGLKVDPNRWGGGLHMTQKGGYLACHKDFSVLPTTFDTTKQLLRVINIIGYLTPGWVPGWGGELELWDAEGAALEKKLAPEFNNWVIFDTRGSFHGHPYPYEGNEPRYSVAAYYYLEEEVGREDWISTNYLKLPWKNDTPEYQQRRKDRANIEHRYKLK